MNIELIYADKLDKKKARYLSKDLSPTLYWLYSKELIGAIENYKECIDGIIFLKS